MRRNRVKREYTSTATGAAEKRFKDRFQSRAPRLIEDAPDLYPDLKPTDVPDDAPPGYGRTPPGPGGGPPRDFMPSRLPSEIQPRDAAATVAEARAGDLSGFDFDAPATWAGGGGYIYEYTPGPRGSAGNIKVTGGHLKDRSAVVRPGSSEWMAILKEHQTYGPQPVPTPEAPASEAPASEAPASEAPASEAPAPEAPAPEAPEAPEAPAPEDGGAEAPTSEDPLQGVSDSDLAKAVRHFVLRNLSTLTPGPAIGTVRRGIGLTLTPWTDPEEERVQDLVRRTLAQAVAGTFEPNPAGAVSSGGAGKTYAQDPAGAIDAAANRALSSPSDENEAMRRYQDILKNPSR